MRDLELLNNKSPLAATTKARRQALAEKDANRMGQMQVQKEAADKRQVQQKLFQRPAGHENQKPAGPAWQPNRPKPPVYQQQQAKPVAPQKPINNPYAAMQERQKYMAAQAAKMKGGEKIVVRNNQIQVGQKKWYGQR
jgi:hypothetical protein